MAAAVTIDDTDPRVSYSPDWQADIDTHDALNSTTHGAFQPGATAVLSFNGSAVDVYGMIAQNSEETDVVSRYTIDEVDLVTNNNASSTTDNLFRQLFFRSPPLDPGPHKLTVTYVDGVSFWLDYFDVIPDSNPDFDVTLHPDPDPASTQTETTTATMVTTKLDPVAVAVTTVVSGAGNTVHATSTFTTTATRSTVSERVIIKSTAQSPTLSPTIPSASSTMQGSPGPFPGSGISRRTPIGAIAGGAAAGVFVLVMVICCFWYMHRRRKAMAAVTPLPFGPGSRYWPLSAAKAQPRQIEGLRVSLYVTRGGTALGKLHGRQGARSIGALNVGTSSVETGNRGDIPPPYGQ
ncbi:hypothetical protein Hypma_001138 [Hypsizygus marmoreus]|uniref:Uncharacterized protein n=1 Tax=Hypsizygus marmoreus TaxID=39966 RepID=A0A369JDE9_HYPMA|nr:hypothetical protein Hypma_001138 [Hypsizygus marmoreus]